MTSAADSRPLHLRLLDTPEDLASRYDNSASEFIEVGKTEGHFEGWDDADVRWPASSGPDPVSVEDAAHRVRLVAALERGIPGRREERLGEAYRDFAALKDAYHQGSLIYLQVKESFLAREGTAEELLDLYQTVYLEALAGADLFSPD